MHELITWLTGEIDRLESYSKPVGGKRRTRSRGQEVELAVYRRVLNRAMDAVLSCGA